MYKPKFESTHFYITYITTNLHYTPSATKQQNTQVHNITDITICVNYELLWTSPNDPRRVHRGLALHYQERCALYRALFPGAQAVEGVEWEGIKCCWAAGGGTGGACIALELQAGQGGEALIPNSKRSWKD